MGVDQAGHDDRVGAVDLFLGPVGAGDLGRWPNGDDGVAADGHRAVFEHVVLLIHRDDGSAAQQDVYGFGHFILQMSVVSCQ